MTVMKAEYAWHRPHARGENVRTHSDYDVRPESRRLADLKHKAAELERKLSDARVSLEHELAQSDDIPVAAPGQVRESRRSAPAHLHYDHDADSMSELYAEPESADYYSGVNSGSPPHSPGGRTETLVSQGRRNAYSPGLSLRRKIAIGLAVAVVIVAAIITMLPGRGASWPSSVATVQGEAARACQNPDVRSEPGQVNFACAKATRQILWVFALMTSGDDPNFADMRTGRLGLEPITPAQGGEVAWSLNLHQPYDPSNPVDSLAVAARAINNIIGGATLTGAGGRPVVQRGLESSAANCVRYTGSAAIISRKGFPSLCAKPVTSRAGQAALVADVFRKWVVGAPPRAARDAAVLFENFNDPGNRNVQAILRHLSHSKQLA
jgi:hypothetical protein